MKKISIVVFTFIVLLVPIVVWAAPLSLTVNQSLLQKLADKKGSISGNGSTSIKGPGMCWALFVPYPCLVDYSIGYNWTASQVAFSVDPGGVTITGTMTVTLDTALDFIDHPEPAHFTGRASASASGNTLTFTLNSIRVPITFSVLGQDVTVANVDEAQLNYTTQISLNTFTVPASSIGRKRDFNGKVQNLGLRYGYGEIAVSGDIVTW